MYSLYKLDLVQLIAHVTTNIYFVMLLLHVSAPVIHLHVMVTSAISQFIARTVDNVKLELVVAYKNAAEFDKINIEKLGYVNSCAVVP